MSHTVPPLAGWQLFRAKGGVHMGGDLWPAINLQARKIKKKSVSGRDRPTNSQQQ